MPDNRPETALVADNGNADNSNEEGRNVGGDHVAPLSDGLIGLLGRLAVKEALTDVPLQDAAPQDDQAGAARLIGVPMGKPLQLIKDKYYFIARCPVTGEILDAIPDDSAGTGVPPTGEWRVACADCNKTHALDLSTIKSEQITARGSHIDAL